MAGNGGMVGMSNGAGGVGVVGGVGVRSGVNGGADAGCCAGPGCAGGVVSCGGDGGAAGCDGGVVSSSLSYVGGGRGDWVTETSYKYVGTGAGDLTVVTQQRRNLVPCFVVVGLLVVAALVFLLWPDTVTTTTIRPQPPVIPTPTPTPNPPPAPKISSCLFWGDPHLVSFDGARPSFYGNGEYWIVKNDQVHIQGRYMGTAYTYGLAATQKVAVGGPFLQDHVIEVEPTEHRYGGHILVDGTPVLTQFGQDRVGNVATIDYNGNGHLVDEAASVWTTRAVHLSLPKGVHMTIFRWGNYLDMKITMPQLDGGVDGSCGNFNGNPADDTPAEVFKRIGARVTDGQLMFSSDAVVHVSDEEETMLETQCPSNTLQSASTQCAKELPASATEGQHTACQFDICFGMNEHALRSAKNYATAAEEKAAHSAD